VSSLQLVMVGLVGVSWVAILVTGFSTYYLVRRRRRKDPTSWPNVSLLKPLAGLDDDLRENLESHLAIDYPGQFELILGVRNEQDAAFPLARAFAEAHPERVRLVLQEGEPGLNPKVNQLITLTRHAKYEIIALTDANVRVHPGYLREHARYLARPNVALTSNGFYGQGEETIGSAFDNMTLTSFVLTALATGDVLLRLSQIISKSVAIRRDALQAIGGWETLKDLLAEDQRLGTYLADKGFRTAIVGTPVANIQRTQGLDYFVQRHARWAMMRFRVVMVGAWLELFLNPTFIATLMLLTAPREPWAWALWGGALLGSMVFTQTMALLSRGRGFAFKWVVLAPLRDAFLLVAWVRGMFMRTVNWRGNVLIVGKETRLSRPGSTPAAED
jgi:ceramide glucosyltransferase